MRQAARIAALLIGVSLTAHAQDQSCPDATDTPQILSYYVGVAYRALATDPGRPLPPPCLLTAIAKVAVFHPDSTITQTLVLADKLLERQPNDVALLETRLTLLSRLKRYREIAPAFDRLLATDSTRATLDVFKSVIAAEMRGGDTASLVRYLATATARYQSTTLW